MTEPTKSYFDYTGDLREDFSQVLVGDHHDAAATQFFELYDKIDDRDRTLAKALWAQNVANLYMMQTIVASMGEDRKEALKRATEMVAIVQHASKETISAAVRQVVGARISSSD